jgi:hypothetical protein
VVRKSENFKVDAKLIEMYILEYCDIVITFDALLSRFRKKMVVELWFLSEACRRRWLSGTILVSHVLDSTGF